MKDKCGVPETDMPHHPNWKCLYSKLVENINESCDSICPCVAAYIHCRLWPLKPKLYSDILHNKDVMLITLNGPEGQINLINTYSDEHGSAIKILRDADLPLIGYLGGDFNCHSNHWDENIVCSNYLAKSLFEFAEEHGLEF